MYKYKSKGHTHEAKKRDAETERKRLLVTNIQQTPLLSSDNRRPPPLQVAAAFLCRPPMDPSRRRLIELVVALADKLWFGTDLRAPENENGRKEEPAEVIKMDTFFVGRVLETFDGVPKFRS